MQDKLKLVEIFSDAFMLILQLRASQEYGDPEMLRQRILHMLEKAEHQARMRNINPEDIQIAKFALVAFIDETIITSDWSQKQMWLANPLQLQLYNRFDAGEEFFQKLEEMRSRFKINIQVLEVIYLCLVLGFKGKYAIMEQEKLKFLIDELLQDLTEFMDQSVKILSPNGKRKEEIRQVIKTVIPIWTIGIGATALGMLFYFIMVFISKGEADKIIDLLFK